MKFVIYACEFPDKHVYVGLTCDAERRKMEHSRRVANSTSAVELYRRKSNLDFSFKVIVDNLSREEAKIAEGKWVDNYKNKGWVILNRTGTGGCGSYGERLFNYFHLVRDEDTDLYYCTGKPFDGNELHDISSHPTYCANDMEVLLSIVNNELFFSHYYARVSSEMLERWRMQGFALEEILCVKYIVGGLQFAITSFHISCKSIGKALVKEIRKAMLVLNPSVLYDLIGIQSRDELIQMLSTDSLEQSLTSEQRKTVNDFICHDVSRLLRRLNEEIRRIKEEHRDDEIEFSGLTHRYVQREGNIYYLQTSTSDSAAE